MLQLNELSAKIGRQRKALLETCAKARNEYSRHQIRRDFRAGMKVSRFHVMQYCNCYGGDFRFCYAGSCNQIKVIKSSQYCPLTPLLHTGVALFCISCSLAGSELLPSFYGPYNTLLP